MTENFLQFMHDGLVPCANRILRAKYEAYCAGLHVGVETKADGTPAGDADRETEAALRALISAQYPDHGIWGEEFGARNIDRDYVWVLDPLDGTKQFIDKRPGFFGCLIGLLHKGKAIAGAISDPIYDKTFISGECQIDSGLPRGNKIVIACTNPIAMLDRAFLQRLEHNNIIKTDMNCMAFVALIEGKADIFIEHGLSIHDIAALIPVMVQAGMVALDFEGNYYQDIVFDLTQASSKKYGIIATRFPDLAHQILTLKPKGLTS